jgi:DNA-binding MarR family transcriptional regulator
MVTSSGDEVDHVVADWRRELPDLDVSSTGIVVPVTRLAALLAEHRAAVLAPHGLDQSHLDVLGVLLRSGAPYRLTAGELSRRCRVTAGATTQRVTAMEGMGLVERSREPEDRRTVLVGLTAAGRERLREVQGAVTASDEAVLSGLPPGDRQALEASLRSWLRRTSA